MNFKNSKSSITQEICDMFADFFQSVYKPNSGTLEVYVNNNKDTHSINIGLPIISTADIIDALKEVSKSVGVDGIPPIVLQKLSCIIEPLALLFNRSLSSGIFPEIWKKSHIVPIFKNGKRSDITNYRGITIIPGIPKLFEKIVTKYLQFDVNNFISIHQHGFVKQRSSITNLCELVMFGINTLEEKSQLDVVYTDFSKAFDCINHTILLEKLNNFGFNSSILNWIKSYLKNRKQYVLVNGHHSKLIDVHSGVPQGSHLGPILFIIFINDIVEQLKYSKCLLYADDLKIFRRIDTAIDAELLQKDVDILVEWCDINKLTLNIKKCMVMSFFKLKTPIRNVYNIAGNNLECVDTIKDLGILFNSNMTFNNHIELISSKCNIILGLIMRLSNNFKNVKAINKISIYFTCSFHL